MEWRIKICYGEAQFLIYYRFAIDNGNNFRLLMTKLGLSGFYVSDIPRTDKVNWRLNKKEAMNV